MSSIIKRYLVRYAWDVYTFLKSYALASVGIFPLILVTTGMFLPFVYLFLAWMGLVMIVFSAVITSLVSSYRFKFLVFLVAVGWMAYSLWQPLSFDPSIEQPGAVNVNRLIFVELLFLFPIAYVFLERQGIKAHFARLMISPDDVAVAND